MIPTKNQLCQRENWLCPVKLRTSSSTPLLAKMSVVPDKVPLTPPNAMPKPSRVRLIAASSALSCSASRCFFFDLLASLDLEPLDFLGGE